MNYKEFLIKTRSSFIYLLLLILSLALMGCKPVVKISSPKNGDEFVFGDEITFSGSAMDFQDGQLTDSSLVWSSDRDGEIGTGTEFIEKYLSIGSHNVTLTAVNTRGEAGTDSITITVLTDNATHITTSDELLTLLNSMTFGADENGYLFITEDVRIIGTITISSEQLELPKIFYYDPEPCPMSFKDSYGADGITLTELPSEKGYVYPPYSLTLTDIKLRFRPLWAPTHPHPCGNSAVFDLLPPTDYECTDGQIRCDEDRVCYEFFDYCIYCLLLTGVECFCRDENGVFDDGTECHFSYGDNRWFGTCQDGECVKIDF